MRLRAIGIILFTYLMAATASHAAIPQPLVNLDASGLADSTDFQSWPNTGTLGGAFSVKLGTTAITVGTVASRKAVTFDSNNGLVTDTTTTLITGKAPYTAAIWVYNPSYTDEEWVFQWGARNSNNRAGYIGCGKRSQYSAFGGFGESGDMPFLNGLPSTSAWHHVVVTYDTTIMRLYVDGVLDHAEGKVQDTAYVPFTVGRYYEAAGKGLIGSVASVQLYTSALSPADVVSLYVSGGGTAPGAEPTSPQVLNASFESPDVGTNLDKTISANSYLMQNWWTNTESAAGITKKGTTSTTWYASTMNSSGAGTQIFLISNDDSRREVRQLVRGFKAKKAYQVSVLASARVGNYNKAPVMIDINGQGLLDTPQIVPLATGTQNWTTVTSKPWVCPADGAYWVSFHTTQGNLNMGPGNYNTSLLLDNVQITEVTAPAAETLVANPVGGQSWGVVAATDASSAKNIVVTNTGTGAVNVTDVVLTGSNKFTLGTVAPGKTTSLAANGTLTVPVTFNPSGAAAGVYTARVVVSTNDAVNPTKTYSVTAVVQSAAAGKRYVLIDDTGVSLGYDNAKGFGQFSGPTALRDANVALNSLATTATTDMMIVDGNGLPDTYAADFAVRQPVTTIRQVANGQNNDATITLASDAYQYDAIIKVCERDCAIKGLDANHKMVLITRFPVKGLIVGIGGLNSAYSPGLAANNFVLSNFKFRGYGEGMQTFSPYGTYNNIDWELASGESIRVSNPSSALYPLAQTTFNNCTAIHTATNTARYFLPIDSANTSTTWNNSLIANLNGGGERGTVWFGNSTTVTPNQTYTYNDCTFDFRNSTMALIGGWTTPGATVIFNNPNFLGPIPNGNTTGLMSLTEGAEGSSSSPKYMTVKISGTPTKKVDLRAIRAGVNGKLPIIRHTGSTFILTDCIIDDPIDIDATRGKYPMWYPTTTLDRCYVMSSIGYNANRRAKHTINATNTIFQAGALTTTSLFINSGDSTSTANINHCTFFSTGDTTTAQAFIFGDANTPVTMNYSIVKGAKPVNNGGIISGTRNIVSFGAAINGTNQLTTTSLESPRIDLTGHIANGTGNPAINGAVGSTLTIDYDGDVRPGGSGGTGSIPDIGADETALVPVELSTFKAE